MNALAIDWGKAVGMATFRRDVHQAWVSDWEVALYVEMPAFIKEGKLDLVIMEDFVISERTTRTAVTKGWKRGRELEFIGATKYLCYQQGLEYVTQTPAQAKDFCTDDKLKRIGWYTKGLDHSRDASRHLLLALVERKVVDARSLIA